MPAIIAFVTTVIVPALGTIFALIAPVAGALFAFTLSNLAKIPRYIKLLRLLYEETEPDSQARKFLTLGLLLLGGILTFMVYSFIPGTALPIIGSVITPIAMMLALVVSLATLDLVFNANEGYYLEKSSQLEEVDDLMGDIARLSEIFGKSWKKLLNLFDEVLPKLEQAISKNPEEFQDISNYLNRQLNGLLQYIGAQEIQPITTSELQRNQLQKQITDGLEPWAKVGRSLVEGLTAGAATGAGASTVASSMFVQAGFWTSLQGLLGLSSGIAVSASTYTLLTVATPIGLGLLATTGVYKGAIHLRNRKERQKMSEFMGDVLIAALPMAWADGHFSIEEKDVFHRLLTNPAILQKDKERVYSCIDTQKTFDEVLETDLLLDRKSRETSATLSEKEKIKHRLLLCVAWEIAKADGTISEEEIALHDRMAKVLPMVTPEAVQEIRRMVTLESGADTTQRISIIKGDITKQSVDAIVNSADKTLLRGKRNRLISWLVGQDRTTIDSAIHHAAGLELLEECRTLKGCAVGEAKITQGYNLPCQWVVHTVSPVWNDGSAQTEKFLAQCYYNSLKLAQKHSIRTIAFPAIGTGSCQFPIERAVEIALLEVKKFLDLNFNLEQVTFVCFEEEIYQHYLSAFEMLNPLIEGSENQPTILRRI